MRKGEKQQKQKLSTARWIVILVCAAVFLFSLYNIIDIFQKYSQSKEIYDNAEKTYTVPVEEEDPIPPVIDFDALTEVNKDVIGWIFIEGTDINYPLLKGKTNKQYLFQSYEKKYAVAGSIFLDYRCSEDFSDYNTVVYGHNMKNGTMFGKLDKYLEKDYLEKHPYVYIILADGSWNKYRVFSCYQAPVDGATYDLPTDTKKKIKAFVSLLKEKNLYAQESDAETGDYAAEPVYTPTGEDRILTLSTCTNDSRNDVRFVVNCVLEEMGTTVTAVNAEKNDLTD